MKINKDTKIAALIKHNAASIEAIVSLAKPFEKLRNPILRKIMAPRVSIAEAAKMGGCSIDDFKRVLGAIGFEFEDLHGTDTAETLPKPQWLASAAKEKIVYFDVRPVIDTGTDPLKEILHQFKELNPGGILCIINSFIPTPLIHLLKQEKADDSYVETLSPQEFHTYFLKKAKSNSPEDKPKATKEKINMDDEQSFMAVIERFAPENRREIDVRELEMPGPMQTILAELQDLQNGKALYVNHKRVPVFLLEELADKDYEIHIYNIEEGNVKMLIFKP